MRKNFYVGVRRRKRGRKMKYNYIVWVGGVDDYYVNYSDAKRDYDEWVSQGYDEVCIEKIKEKK